jgi:ElaB/YqjD/DUF883 family membrane-anchored ribosome-binding protein
MMSESYTEGGAGPALAAHSKDGSARGQTAASEATGTTGRGSGGAMAGQAQESMSNAASSAYNAAGQARDMLSDRAGQVADQAGQFVRDQPVFMLMVTGLLCLMLGILLGRR